MKLGYLYYDLLNLYGENGNIRIISDSLKQMGIANEILLISADDEINFDEYDLIYIGAGTERNFEIAFKKLSKYKQDIKNFIENNKFFIATGNSIELFSKNYLDILEYKVDKRDVRFSSEALLEYKNLKPLIGLFNQINTTTNSNLFKVVKGLDQQYEGFKYKNFYGTYLLGPILIRNPHFLLYMLKEITKKDPIIDLEYETKAYETFIINIDKNKKL